MQSELVAISSLSLDPANVRKHPDKNIQSIIASLKRFGQQKPIVVDANGIVRAGNGTLMAAQQLGYTEIAIVRSPLKGSEATAYAIADNRTAELAEWDEGSLAEQLAALQIEDEELALATGFDDKEIENITSAFSVSEVPLGDLPEGDPDEFQQMTFVLHNEQVSAIHLAIKECVNQKMATHEKNTNRNGNAIAEICKAWMNGLR